MQSTTPPLTDYNDDTTNIRTTYVHSEKRERERNCFEYSFFSYVDSVGDVNLSHLFIGLTFIERKRVHAHTRQCTKLACAELFIHLLQFLLLPGPTFRSFLFTIHCFYFLDFSSPSNLLFRLFGNSGSVEIWMAVESACDTIKKKQHPEQNSRGRRLNNPSDAVSLIDVSPFSENNLLSFPSDLISVYLF